MADADFRSTPESRHPATRLSCPLRAMNGLMHRSKQYRYSITSPASCRMAAVTWCGAHLHAAA
jgi:hypothetical protein